MTPRNTHPLAQRLTFGALTLVLWAVLGCSHKTDSAAPRLSEATAAAGPIEGRFVILCGIGQNR